MDRQRKNDWEDNMNSSGGKAGSWCPLLGDSHRILKRFGAHKYNIYVPKKLTFHE